MFRRRRGEESDEISAQDELLEDEEELEEDDEDAADASEQSDVAIELTGPYDIADAPDTARADFGSIQVPVHDGLDLQVQAMENQLVFVTAVLQEFGSLQLQAFAAPKTLGIWEDVREEILADLEKNQQEAEEAEGPFGTEIRAMLPFQLPPEAMDQLKDQLPPEVVESGVVIQPTRFLGIDGPRWFLRAVINGPAAVDEEAAKPIEEMLRGVVVSRGDGPMAPRDLLPLTLPEEMQQAMAQQQGEGGEQPAEGQGGADGEAAEGDDMFNPFERGPESTETR